MVLYNWKTEQVAEMQYFCKHESRSRSSPPLPLQILPEYSNNLVDIYHRFQANAFILAKENFYFWRDIDLKV